MATPPAVPASYIPCDNPRAYKWKRNICKCIGCRDETVREQKRASIRAARGISDKLVPVEETVDAIRRLMHHSRKSKLGVAAIARFAGVSEETVWAYKRGDNRYVKSSIARKIVLLANMDPKDPRFPKSRVRHDQVDTDRAVRIIHGLMLQGYPQTWIAKQMGYHPNTQVSGWSRGKTKFISIENDEKLLEIAKAVGYRRGPNERTANIARSRGYKALAEWDDLL